MEQRTCPRASLVCVEASYNLKFWCTINIFYMLNFRALLVFVDSLVYKDVKNPM